MMDAAQISPETEAEHDRPIPLAHAPDLRSYDRIVVAFSGGKDSIASLLSVLESGVPPERVDVYHHDVDGHGPAFMDWPSTTGYCRAVAASLGVPLYLSWKEGGFLRPARSDTAAGRADEKGRQDPKAGRSEVTALS